MEPSVAIKFGKFERLIDAVFLDFEIWVRWSRLDMLGLLSLIQYERLCLLVAQLGLTVGITKLSYPEYVWFNKLAPVC